MKLTLQKAQLLWLLLTKSLGSRLLLEEGPAASRSWHWQVPCLWLLGPSAWEVCACLHRNVPSLLELGRWGRLSAVPVVVGTPPWFFGALTSNTGENYKDLTWLTRGTRILEISSLSFPKIRKTDWRCLLSWQGEKACIWAYESQLQLSTKALGKHHWTGVVGSAV